MLLRQASSDVFDAVCLLAAGWSQEQLKRLHEIQVQQCDKQKQLHELEEKKKLLEQERESLVQQQVRARRISD